MATKQKKSQCRALTKAGKRCRAPAGEGGLCFFHANPKKASELGRIGGRSKGYTALENIDSLLPLDSVLAVQEMGTRMGNDLYSGKLKPGVAQALVRVLTMQIRTIEVVAAKRSTALEKRIAKLEEKRSAEAAAEKRVDGDAETSEPSDPDDPDKPDEPTKP